MAAIDDIIDLLEAESSIDVCYYGSIPSNVLQTLNRFYYAVVSKSTVSISNGSARERIRVAIVFENRIPDGYVKTIINKIRDKGFKFDETSGVSYDYGVVKNTALSLEGATFYVVKSARWC